MIQDLDMSQFYMIEESLLELELHILKTYDIDGYTDYLNSLNRYSTDGINKYLINTKEILFILSLTPQYQGDTLEEICTDYICKKDVFDNYLQIEFMDLIKHSKRNKQQLEKLYKISKKMCNDYLDFLKLSINKNTSY